LSIVPLKLFSMWVMKTNNDIKDSFSAHLRECLKQRYGKIPSAAVVARDFNLRAYGTSPISQESARRWIRGVSLPEEDRLRVLVNWLNLDFNHVLKNPGIHRIIHPNHEQAQEMNHSIWVNHPPVMSDLAHPIESNGHSKEDQEIIEMIFSLDDKQRAALAELVKAIYAQHHSP